MRDPIIPADQPDCTDANLRDIAGQAVAAAVNVGSNNLRAFKSRLDGIDWPWSIDVTGDGGFGGADPVNVRVELDEDGGYYAHIGFPSLELTRYRGDGEPVGVPDFDEDTPAHLWLSLARHAVALVRRDQHCRGVKAACQMVGSVLGCAMRLDFSEDGTKVAFTIHGRATAAEDPHPDPGLIRTVMVAFPACEVSYLTTGLPF